MSPAELFSDNLWLIVCLIAVAVALTFAVFHWRKFDEGYEKGRGGRSGRRGARQPPR